MGGFLTRFFLGGSSDEVLGARGLRLIFRGGSSDEVLGVRGLRFTRRTSSDVELGVRAARGARIFAFGVGGGGGTISGAITSGAISRTTSASTGLTLLSEPLGRPAFLLTASI